MNSRLTTYYTVAIAMTLGWFFFAYTPASRNLTALNSEIARTENQLNDFKQTVLRLPEFLELREDLLSTRQHMQTTLYAKRDILKLLDRIKSEAIDHRMRIVEIAPPIEELLQLNEAMDQSDEPQFLNITLRLSGGYLNFGRYVTDLETAPYFRGINLCKIYEQPEIGDRTGFVLGFKALLGKGRETT